MALHDPVSQRLFLRAILAPGAAIELDRSQANYLVNVLRLSPGDRVRVFNGQDGEWQAALAERGRRAHVLVVGEQTRPQTAAPDLHYLFAPLKQGRLDYMVQKAVEMGAGRLRPVLTQHTQLTRLNLQRLEANAIEAAEQCGLLSLPHIDEPVALRDLIEQWPEAEAGRRIIFCDEEEDGRDPLAVLAATPAGPLAVLIGPEGGFSADERYALRSVPFVTPISLGPRILRADTAAVAALALVQATRGDWRTVVPPDGAG